MSVVLSDLPIAGSADNSDITLLRKGLTDYQCAVQLIRQINVSSLNSLPTGSAAASDLMLISRTISGNPTNFRIPFNQVGFIKDTLAWFYQSSSPSGWSIESGTGDRLLAVSGTTTSTKYAGANRGTQGGTWQQTDYALTTPQIPNHTHNMECGQTTSNSALVAVKGTQDHNSPKKFVPTEGILGSSNASGVALGHNHGAIWRPAANVGIICRKTT